MSSHFLGVESLFRAFNRRLEETQTQYQRYLYSKIDWSERLIGIKGPKGVGKTTMLQEKRLHPDCRHPRQLCRGRQHRDRLRQQNTLVALWIHLLASVPSV